MISIRFNFEVNLATSNDDWLFKQAAKNIVSDALFINIFPELDLQLMILTTLTLI